MNKAKYDFKSQGFKNIYESKIKVFKINSLVSYLT